MNEDLNRESVHLLMRELLASIRETNRRISELSWVVKGDLYKDSLAKAKIVKRIERLINTRMCLIYSVYDIRYLDAFFFNKKSSFFSLNKLYCELKSL